MRLCVLLTQWADPASTFWTATDPIAPSALAGAMRKRRGVKAGVPDTLLWSLHTLPIGIEMKSPDGRCSHAQRSVRQAMLRAGCEWWECRSANAAMWALAKSGVQFRTIRHSDGTVETWRQPALQDWELPRSNPAHRRPGHPDVRERRRAERQRWRERQRPREAA